MTRETKLEFLGSIVGIAGAILLALNIDASKYGFVLFFISSFAFMWMAYLKQMQIFLLNQFVFQIINIIGISRWFF